VLTEEGRAVLARAVPLWVATHAEVEGGLSDPDCLRAELLALSPLDE